LQAQGKYSHIFCCTQPNSLLPEIELPFSLVPMGRGAASVDVRCPAFRDIAMIWFSRDARPALSHIKLRTETRKSESCWMPEISDFVSCPTDPQWINFVVLCIVCV
jgi:hypothetical protein